MIEFFATAPRAGLVFMYSEIVCIKEISIK